MNVGKTSEQQIKMNEGGKDQERKYKGMNVGKD